jgi:toxin ParE1/3/4
MHYEVLLTSGAERDLESIHDYLAENDGEAAADRVLRRITEVGARLSEHPERGTHPRELLALGIREYRQLHMKPYRVIYNVVGTRVHIVLIADGRREMQSLLARRLLGAP